jgi:hypothetical protein
MSLRIRKERPEKMITTVTTAALAGLATPALAVSLGAAAVISLIIFLIMKELSSAELESGKPAPKLKSFASNLNVAILPLLLVFVVIVAVKIAEIL